MEKQPAIAVEGLQKTFHVGFFRKKVRALQGVSFRVEQNEIVGLVGPNGAGKTTTMKVLTGLVSPDEGSAALFGDSVDRFQSRNRLGYLPENPYFYEHLKVSELLRFYGNLFGLHGSELQKRIDSLIERVGLEHAVDRPIKKFSKGMRQRAGLAQALINDPDLVILDEPQSGLDPVGRQQVRDLIFELKQEGKTVLFSSHIMPDVEAVCDRVVLVHKGEVLESGTLSELTGDRVVGVELVVQATDIEKVETLDGLESVQKRGETLVIRFPGDAQTDLIARQALDADLSIISLQRQREHLENVFVRDTYGSGDDEGES